MADGPRWKRRKQANPRRNHGESSPLPACPCACVPAPAASGNFWVRECGNSWREAREAAASAGSARDRYTCGACELRSQPGPAFNFFSWFRRTFRTRFFSGLGAELGAVSEPGPGSAELRCGSEHVDQRRGAEPSRSCDPKTPKLSRVQGPEQERSEPGGAVARTGSQSGFGLKCGRLVQKRGVGGRSFNCVTRRGTETGGVVARSACGL